MRQLVLFILAVLSIGSAFGKEGEARVAELFGAPALAVMQHPDRVEACLLRRIGPNARPDGSVDWSSERYEESTWVAAEKGPAGNLLQLLQNEKTYDWEANGGRRPEFYVRLRFGRGDDAVTIDLCFLCKLLQVQFNHTALGHANFSGNADLLLQTCVKLFPHDEPLRQAAREAGLPL